MRTPVEKINQYQEQKRVSYQIKIWNKLLFVMHALLCNSFGDFLFGFKFIWGKKDPFFFGSNTENRSCFFTVTPGIMHLICPFEAESKVKLCVYCRMGGQRRVSLGMSEGRGRGRDTRVDNRLFQLAK